MLNCASPPNMSVPTYYVCPHLLCLSPPIMSVPTFYVCPHLLCLSPPFMSAPTYNVCPKLLCLSPPIMSVPTHHFFLFSQKYLRTLQFFIWPTQLRFRVWHSQLSLFKIIFDTKSECLFVSTQKKVWRMHWVQRYWQQAELGVPHSKSKMSGPN